MSGNALLYTRQNHSSPSGNSRFSVLMMCVLPGSSGTHVTGVSLKSNFTWRALILW